MALPMEEQRILAEIERQLADDYPSLARRLAAFGRPGLAARLRTPRGRVLASFLAIASVAVLSLLVYLLISLRTPPARAVHPRPAGVHREVVTTASPGIARARPLAPQVSRQSCSRYCSRPSSSLRALWNSSPSGSKSRSNSSSYNRTTLARLRA
jgi:hypothetical protein